MKVKIPNTFVRYCNEKPWEIWIGCQSAHGKCKNLVSKWIWKWRQYQLKTMKSPDLNLNWLPVGTCHPQTKTISCKENEGFHLGVSAGWSRLFVLLVEFWNGIHHAIVQVDLLMRTSGNVWLPRHWQTTNYRPICSHRASLRLRNSEGSLN